MQNRAAPYNGAMRGVPPRPGRIVRLVGATTVLATACVAMAAAQAVPKPFPRSGDPAPAQQAPQPPKVPPAAAAPAPGSVPNEETLGLPIYPSAQYLASYDAGRGQRYFLFGTTAAFGEVVAYYRNVLRLKGELVFDQPPTHMFEAGRFREDSMAFPPGITVKDFSWMTSGGFLNPKPGAQPTRFPTIVQVVPLVAPGRSPGT